MYLLEEEITIFQLPVTVVNRTVCLLINMASKRKLVSAALLMMIEDEDFDIPDDVFSFVVCAAFINGYNDLLLQIFITNFKLFIYFFLLSVQNQLITVICYYYS